MRGCLVSHMHATPAISRPATRITTIALHHARTRLHHACTRRCRHVVAMLAAFETEPKLYLVFKACMRGDLYQLLMKEPTRRLNEELVASSVSG